jgi:uncharacterized protein
MTAIINDTPLVHNEAAQRFEMHMNGLVPFMEYSRTGNMLIIAHTEVPAELEGRGIGKMLAEKTFAYIEEQGWKIIPLCPFASSYIKRHPEWDRIVHHVL